MKAMLLVLQIVFPPDQARPDEWLVIEGDLSVERCMALLYDARLPATWHGVTTMFSCQIEDHE